jgi:hypothetical protein
VCVCVCVCVCACVLLRQHTYKFVSCVTVHSAVKFYAKVKCVNLE